MIWELGGVTLDATDGPLLVREFDPGERNVRGDFLENPVGDGSVAGREFITAPTWTFDIATMGDTEDEALFLAAQVERAWRPPELREAWSSVPLRYRLNGRWRRVYGRPGRLVGVNGDTLTAAGVGRLLGTFRLTDPIYYDDELSSLTMGLLSNSTGILELPEALPWDLGRASGTRNADISVGGEVPVPFQVLFHGPTAGTASGLWAEGDGWRVEVDTTLAWDQTIVVDTRNHTVLRNGVSVVGAVKGRFLSAKLGLGTQQIRWGATDPSQTSTMEIQWRSGWWSL